ncbi:MAG: T9SS C-terminal target domain-containing protein, partial [Calditrichaeota bacterium]
TRADINNLIGLFDGLGISAVADVVYNHRDGGMAEDNPSVQGWITSYDWTKADAGDQPFPSDRYRCYLAIGGATGRGAGTYYFKISSASNHGNFNGKTYKVYMETNTVGWKSLADLNESEPNGGGDCVEGNNTIELGRNMLATVETGGSCGTDEFALTITSGDFNATGDTIWIYLNNTNVGGLDDYSDHRIYGTWYSGGWDVAGDIKYQTWTDFTSLPSGRGGMNYLNFKPNGNPTQLAGDWDAMYFFYDYDQAVVSTQDTLFAWSKWLWDDVGIRGYRMDAVKHFSYEFTGDLFDYFYDNGIVPEIAVGEFFDSNAGILKNWIDNVYSYMDTDTKTAIHPRLFDFSLRQALKDACDSFGYDARNVFNSGMVDAAGSSGFNVVTFINNHDFRDPGQEVQNDPMLAYAYILTNNQVGLPSIFYPDYFESGLKSAIDSLIGIHKDYIFGATAIDHLSRIGTTYTQNFFGGYNTTTLVYQLNGGTSGRDVVVAINFAGESLNMDQGVNISTLGLSPTDTLTALVGHSAVPYSIIDGSGKMHIELPPRSYAVWVEGSPDYLIPVELTSFGGQSMENGVLLSWSTASESENLGFHIYRSQSPDKDFVKVTEELIPGEVNSTDGRSYHWTDVNVQPGMTYYYKLADINLDGMQTFHGPITVTFSSVTSIDEMAMPLQFKLDQNYPNPFNPVTTIRFALPESKHVKLTIFNTSGQLVYQLINASLSAGAHTAIWNANDMNGNRVASGLYVYRLETDGQILQKKLILMK